jgi:SAM-dependent methyltransferase
MKFNYENKQYLKKFENMEPDFFLKYLAYVKYFLKNKKNSFIDIGCGNGNALVPLMRDGYKNIYGCEISKLFVDAAKKRDLKNIYWYDGKRMPFEDNYFDVVGSFGVLEHTENSNLFLEEHVRIAKKEGYIIVTCPNFLTVFYRLEHPRVNTLWKRLKNIPKIFKKMCTIDVCFEKSEPIIRKEFQFDDDMVTVSNLVDMEKFFKKSGCTIVYSNGFMVRDNMFLKIVGSLPVLRYFLSSCFIVARKN